MFRYYLIIFLNVSIVFFCCGSSTESFEMEEEVSYINFIKYPDSLHLFVFNVGQGNFCLIKKAKSAIIVDAGSGNSKANFTKFNDIKEILKKVLGPAKIKAVIITHPHADHYNLLPPLSQDDLGLLDKNCFFVIGGNRKDIEDVFMSFARNGDVYFCSNEIFYQDISLDDLCFHGENICEKLFKDHIRWVERSFTTEFIESKLNALIPGSCFEFLHPVVKLLPIAEKKR